MRSLSGRLLAPVGAALACALVAACHGGSEAGSPGAEPSPPPPQTIAAASTADAATTMAGAAAAATLSSPKLSPELAAMARKVAAAADATVAQALSNRRVHVNSSGQIQAYVYVNRVDASMETALRAAGAEVERGVATMKVYQVWASPIALARIARLPDVVRITPPAYGFPK